ncbi:MAG: polyhydroxyalkanoic acid system family protein, partial [Alicycliphilus sp.]|nr:polyhydroxyalkanoic acid system family protein [Alicycliphilus sp.]
QFEMKAQLGFLLGAFKDRIEAEIGEQLDALLNAPHPSVKKPAADRKKAATDTDAGKPAPKAAAKPAAKTRKH